MSSIDYAAIRESNLSYLSGLGFKVAAGLPLGPRGDGTGLRPLDEIARRLWALNCLFDYVAAPTKKVPTMKICKCMLRSDLRSFLTSDELAVLDGWRSKSQRRHADTIGWRLENMLPLAWIFGFAIEPDVDGDMLEGEPVNDLVEGFLGSLEQTLVEWMADKSTRAEAVIIEREDLFYCAHNAVRSAQMGEQTVPAGFDPAVCGGVIHERRHALTWAISPGVAWDDTDLST
jgi:hypothetical protein